MLFVLKIGESGCLRGKARHTLATGQTRKGKALFGHGRYGGAVIGKRQVFLGLNVRLQGDKGFSVKGRAPTDRASPGSTRVGISVISDARMTRTTVVYVIR